MSMLAERNWVATSSEMLNKFAQIKLNTGHKEMNDF